MKMTTKVKTPGSFAIVDVTYHESVEELSVHMQKGQRLVYANVPKSVFEEFLKTDSKGKFFNERIRNVYTFLGEV
jgi:hypothetical protein